MISTATAIHARSGRLKLGKARASKTPETKESKRRNFRGRIWAKGRVCAEGRVCALLWPRSGAPVERPASTAGDGLETLTLKFLPREIGGLRVGIRSDSHAIITAGAGRPHAGGEFLALSCLRHRSGVGLAGRGRAPPAAGAPRDGWPIPRSRG